MISPSPQTVDNARCRIGAGLTALALLAVVSLWPRPAHSVNAASVPPAPALHGPYRTNFLHAENPISEGGHWLNGQKDGLDWADVQTIPGRAFGLEIGGVRPEPQNYDDATAVLTGNWGPNQTVEATVFSTHPTQTDTMWEEVELRLRSSITPHNCTGYEVMFRCSKIPKAYCNIARWEGALGKFTYLKNLGGSQYGVKTGDVVKASMIGNVITVYINGAQIIRVTDDKFSSGNPGMGFFLDHAKGVNRDYGFSSFMATDQ